ncbi:hypothetical protein PSACC_01165 [Paramicrosporidium saccamoebae]|uniref:Mediator of RNA polymerase II transcription subunit 14 n=1 Tax=Paramicrosporidium saccamoebae TaxID=1246581 RepID=A0A2H9TMY9_9FUNG|nr:hypothetical protein PSACC_01165 [Paramicrosporidium saccamoebae]
MSQVLSVNFWARVGYWHGDKRFRPLSLDRMSEGAGRIPKLVIPRLVIKTAHDDIGSTIQSHLTASDHSRRLSTAAPRGTSDCIPVRELLSSICQKCYHDFENLLEVSSRMNIVEKKRDVLRLLREQSERFVKLVSLTRWISWTGELSSAEAVCDKLLLVQQELLAIADSLVHSSTDARLIKLCIGVFPWRGIPQIQISSGSSKLFVPFPPALIITGSAVIGNYKHEITSAIDRLAKVIVVPISTTLCGTIVTVSTACNTFQKLSSEIDLNTGESGSPSSAGFLYQFSQRHLADSLEKLEAIALDKIRSEALLENVVCCQQEGHVKCSFLGSESFFSFDGDHLRFTSGSEATLMSTRSSEGDMADYISQSLMKFSRQCMGERVSECCRPLLKLGVSERSVGQEILAMTLSDFPRCFLLFESLDNGSIGIRSLSYDFSLDGLNDQPIPLGTMEKAEFLRALYEQT